MLVVEKKTEKAQDLISRELEAARLRLQPISRRRLVSIVSKSLDMSPHEAETLVEEYCDERAPATPEYLGRELFLPYVKLMALVISILGIAAVGWGASLWHHHEVSWPFFVLGFVAFVFGGIGLLKALRGEQEAAQEEREIPSSELPDSVSVL